MNRVYLGTKGKNCALLSLLLQVHLSRCAFPCFSFRAFTSLFSRTRYFMKAGNSQQYRAKAMRHSEILQSYLVDFSFFASHGGSSMEKTNKPFIILKMLSPSSGMCGVGALVHLLYLGGFGFAPFWACTRQPRPRFTGSSRVLSFKASSPYPGGRVVSVSGEPLSGLSCQKGWVDLPQQKAEPPSSLSTSA